MEKLTKCPVCGNQNFKAFLTGKDHFLNGEEFTIVQCIDCSFCFTNPRPDETEMPRYYQSEDYIAHDGGKRSVLQTIYKSVRSFTIRSKYSIVQKNSNGLSLLDIGCGTGEFLNYCRKKNFEATGIEPNIKARKFATEKFGLTVLEESLLDEFLPDSCHVITMWHVLEHIHKLNERLKRIHELLKSDGTLIIAVPNCNSWDAKKYREFWAAYDLPRHLYHFTPDSMKLLLNNHSFLVEKIIPLKFDAFYISLLSKKYLSGRQNFPVAFYNGIRSNIFAANNKNNYSSLIYICKIAQDLK